MIKYKLINQDRTTRKGRTNEMTWSIGELREATGNGGLCTDGLLHCYDDPYLTLFLNPIHTNIHDPIVCEVEVGGKSESDGQLKCGYKRMRVVRDIDIPYPTTEQCIEFAIWCGLLVCDDPVYTQWATKWLNNEDRTQAEAEAEAAWAVWAAEAVRAWAVWAAVRAALAAVRVEAEAEAAVRAFNHVVLADIAHYVMGVERC